jgi:DNA-binding transcriptional MerR regulator
MGILIKAPTRRRDPAVPVIGPVAVPDNRSTLHIREVVRITGLRREQLYMWQRRYGFPDPSRDGFGDRVYPPDQVARLKLIKQLLSEGWRAGAVVPLAESALQSMLGIAVEDPVPLPGEIESAVKLLAEHRVGELQNHLSKLLVGQGLRRFLEKTLIPLNEAVHERVVRGDMQNFQELRFGDLAQRLLRDVTRLVRPTRDAAQRSKSARAGYSRAAAVYRGHQLPDARGRRARAGDRRRSARLQGLSRDPALRSRHFRQDRGAGDPLAALRAA